MRKTENDRWRKKKAFKNRRQKTLMRMKSKHHSDFYVAIVFFLVPQAHWRKPIMRSNLTPIPFWSKLRPSQICIPTASYNEHYDWRFYTVVVCAEVMGSLSTEGGTQIGIIGSNLSILHLLQSKSAKASILRCLRKIILSHLECGAWFFFPAQRLIFLPWFASKTDGPTVV